MAHRLAEDLCPDLCTWWGMAQRLDTQAMEARQTRKATNRSAPTATWGSWLLAPAMEVGEHDEDGDDDQRHLSDGDGAVIHRGSFLALRAHVGYSASRTEVWVGLARAGQPRRSAAHRRV